MRIALCLVLLPFPALADGPEARCAAPGDWPARIAACSELIAGGGGERARARAFLHRGEAHLALGDTLEAVRDFREAAGLAPDLAAPHLNLAAAYLELGRPDAAQQALGDAAARAPNAPELWYWTARIEDRLDRPEAALAALDRALALDPGHAAARLARARLRCAMGDVEGAAADSREALDRGALGRETLADHLAAAGFPPAEGGDPLAPAVLQDWARAKCP